MVHEQATRIDEGHMLRMDAVRQGQVEANSEGMWFIHTFGFELN